MFEHKSRRPHSWLLISVIISALLVVGCRSTRVVKTTEIEDLRVEIGELPESHLLDIGIAVFDPGLDNMSDYDDENQLLFPEIRMAEARYLPSVLMDTLQSSAAWGAVRMTPDPKDTVEVQVTGTILQSDGEVLSLRIHVQDASGKTWFTRQYDESTSRYSYETKLRSSRDPFQGIYNRIANDLLSYRQSLDEKEYLKLRTISNLKFAQSFSPKAFSDHLKVTGDGLFELNRLPANDDPMLMRIKQIQERDHLFIDTLQEYYGSFTNDMKKPYRLWRQESYHEAKALREMKKNARNSKLAGAAAILGGIIAAGNSSGSARAAGAIGVSGGAYVLKSGFDQESEAQLHIETLVELGDSLGASIEPMVIELEDRSITLTGTVSNQYDQWRKILEEIYHTETGM